MKVERTESKFEPVIIVLESQFEVDVLRELCGSVLGRGEVRTFTSEVYHALENYATDAPQYFIGDVHVNIKVG